MRRFSLASASSTLTLLPGIGTFPGFVGHLELAAGVPDPLTGLASVAVTGASDYLSLSIPGGPTFCIRPLLPAPAAGVLDCDGGSDLGVTSTVDHDIGTVGVDGFTAEDCAAQGGVVEGEGDPHPGVCNGPIEVGPANADAGPGALLIGADARFATQGLPAEISFELGPCSQHTHRQATVFGLVTGLSAAAIHDADAMPEAVREFAASGEAFSCQAWQSEDGPGRLVLAIPALHGLGDVDLITVVTLDD